MYVAYGDTSSQRSVSDISWQNVNTQAVCGNLTCSSLVYFSFVGIYL